MKSFCTTVYEPFLETKKTERYEKSYELTKKGHSKTMNSCAKFFFNFQLQCKQTKKTHFHDKETTCGGEGKSGYSLEGTKKQRQIFVSRIWQEKTWQIN